MILFLLVLIVLGPKSICLVAMDTQKDTFVQILMLHFITWISSLLLTMTSTILMSVRSFVHKPDNMTKYFNTENFTNIPGHWQWIL
jgi:hypothetical protein